MSTTIEQPVKHSRVVGKAREKMTKQAVSRYKKGASIRQIAAEFGRSYGNVHRMLREAGVELRGRGGSVRKKK